MTDVAEVLPVTHEVVIGGVPVVVNPIRVGQLPRAMALCEPFYRELKGVKAKQASAMAKAADPEYPKAGIQALLKEADIDLYDMILRHSDSVLQLIALLTDKDRQWVDDLAVDEFVSIFVMIVEVNTDFFLQRLLPLLSGVMAGVRKLKTMAAEQNGPTPSNP